MGLSGVGGIQSAEQKPAIQETHELTPPQSRRNSEDDGLQFELEGVDRNNDVTPVIGGSQKGLV